ncbi:MAG: gamma-glutamylcyclotransferase [bacterium]|nr:gamma-glutamylcyclotransferase [bacterium]
MKKERALPLFVYGTLSYDRSTRAITGRIFPKRPGVLDGYARIAPPHGYPYIVPRRGGRVNGYLLDEVDAVHLRLFDRYEAEGDMYRRREVTVRLGGRRVRAYAYVADRANLGHFTAPEPLGAAYAEALDGVIARGEDGLALSPEEAAARRELLAGAIEEMLQARGHLPALPEREIRRLFLSPGVPTLAAVRADPEMRRYADAYILLAVRHIVFNRLEEKMAAPPRGADARACRYFGHAESSLLALRYANARAGVIDRLLEEMECVRLRDDWEYTDYAVCAVRIANLVFDEEEAAGLRRWLHEHRRPGAVPLGAELEFSPLGAGAVGAGHGEDPVYDGFHYFHDFDLLRRGWKLGMYVDNHRAATMPGERSRGFLEYALGRCRIHEDVSRPVTDDPWILAALVEEAARFPRIPPHSLHVSIQIPPGRGYGPAGSADDLACLLMLGGDLRRDGNGAIREMRIRGGEIADARGGIYFSKENTHDADDGTRTTVMEYQFPRLAVGRDYLPLVMALKGFQGAGNPGPVNPFMEDAYRPDHPLLAALRAWAEEPRPLGGREIRSFIDRVGKGLRSEDGGRPAHDDAFIERSLDGIRTALLEKNALLRGAPPA